MVSIKDLAHMICPDESKHVYTEPRKIDLMQTLCDTQLLEEKLDGWKPTTMIKDYLIS